MQSKLSPGLREQPWGNEAHIRNDWANRFSEPKWSPISKVGQTLRTSEQTRIRLRPGHPPFSTETGSDQRIQRSFHFTSIRPANKRTHQNAALRHQTHYKKNPCFSPWLVEACSQGRCSPRKDPVCEHAPTSCLSAWHQSAPMGRV